MRLYNLAPPVNKWECVLCHYHLIHALYGQTLDWCLSDKNVSHRILSAFSWFLKDDLLEFQFSCSVVSDSLQPHGLQQARLPYPSPTPGIYSGSCPLSRWCHPTISSSVIPFSSCLQSLPSSGSFQMSWLFTSGGQSIGVSASTSVLPMSTQDWSPLGWTG